jgi:hypothetical protein
MNEERTIRYVTPPAFFLGSLLLGVWLADPSRLEQLAKDDFLHLAAAIGASLFPIGFVITGVSTFILFLLSLFSRSNEPYQAALDDAAWGRIWQLLKFQEPPEKSRMNKLNAAQTFDHELLPEQTHAGAARLWSAFNIAAHSSTALILSLPAGHYFLAISWSAPWVISTLLFTFLLCGIAIVTWRRHMAFLDLQTRRDWNSLTGQSRSGIGHAESIETNPTHYSLLKIGKALNVKLESAIHAAMRGKK